MYVCSLETLQVEKQLVCTFVASSNEMYRINDINGILGQVL